MSQALLFCPADRRIEGIKFGIDLAFISRIIGWLVLWAEVFNETSLQVMFFELRRITSKEFQVLIEWLLYFCCFSNFEFGDKVFTFCWHSHSYSNTLRKLMSRRIEWTNSATDCQLPKHQCEILLRRTFLFVIPII
jgi:hypothetical protein